MLNQDGVGRSDILEEAIAANHHLKIQEMQKEFRNIVAHELRNSVTPILGLAEIIEARHAVQKDYNYLLDVRFNITELKAHLKD
jgi:signal transduction histidine kinase